MESLYFILFMKHEDGEREKKIRKIKKIKRKVSVAENREIDEFFINILIRLCMHHTLDSNILYVILICISHTI